ncbi:MAG: TonB-dependent receptor [Thermoanaerobaculales bacterium]|jgi:iron complex outermembrane receptor protein|nr:TonB-dependent receptor [Thermoanaerobaculales bacterium]
MRSFVLVMLGVFAGFVTGGTAGAAEDATRVTVSGAVVDQTGRPVEGASISSRGEVLGASGSDGAFDIRLRPGAAEIIVRHPAFREVRRELLVADDLADVRFELQPVLSATESITVTAIRAGDEAPVTVTNLSSAELEQLSYGQDTPKLLQYTPSVTWYSDSGIGSNYSYLSLRGIGQTRINMTFDGAPLNDPAEHALYFNNFHDFTSTVDSIQIQRGVGTSTVGSPSFGGSINFASNPMRQFAGGNARLTVGSYDTLKASAAYESGIIGNGFAVGGRISYADTDGYRDHSGSEHLTVFLNGEWRGERSSLKLVSFFGSEESQLAWWAVDPDTLADNPTFNPMGEEERDDFSQDFIQLQYTRALGEATTLVAQVYYNGADGFFHQWDDPYAQNVFMDFGIDQHFIGGMVTASRQGERLTMMGGVHYNDFSGDHTLDIEGERIYLNTGLKQTANAFAKAEVPLGSWLLYGDVQLRWAEFDYEGDVDLGSVDWSFVDPRVGVRYHVSPNLSLYGSVGQAHREPARLDMLAGEDNATVPHDLESVDPEKVTDLEAGLGLNTSKLALNANLYWMDFSDEIALTGELSEIGLPLRRNVESSFRRGIELDLRWLVARNWALTTSANFSHNRIDRWTQYVDVFDEDFNWLGSEPLVFDDVEPLLTPEVVVNQTVEWTPGPWQVAAVGRFIGESYLDNTGNDDLVAPSYVNLDLRAAVTLNRLRSLGRPTITLFVNNVLDKVDQYPGGYSWQYISREPNGDELVGIPYYYPLATRNIMLTVDFTL